VKELWKRLIFSNRSYNVISIITIVHNSSSLKKTHALLHTQSAGPFCQFGDEQMLALKRLAGIFEGALPTHKTVTASPQGEIADSDTPTKVQITVSPPKVPNTATSPRVVQPIVTYIEPPNSHRRLNPTPCRAVTPSTPHPMIRRSVTQQNISNDMLAETVQQPNHIFSLSTGPTVRKIISIAITTPVIIMPELANTVIFHYKGKSLKHQELITMLRYKIKWKRSHANEIHRLCKNNTIRFIRKSISMIFSNRARAYVRAL
jgi:hypothetical protein